jgi:outer membrane protein assembly factor BamB
VSRRFDQPGTLRNSPARRPPPGRRQSERVYRRRRTVVATAFLSVVIIIAVLATGGGKSKTKTPPGKVAADQRGPVAVPAIKAGLLPWTLTSALSREVVLPGPGASVTVVGGLTASQGSSSTIFELNTVTGVSSPVGRLSAGTHDAAGAQLGTQDLLLGGGTPTTVATVESFSAPGTGQAIGSSIGSLPQPRSDASAVTIGPKVYVVGGYDGTSPDASVVSTADGMHFKTVSTLPIPVRYPAVAALGNKIYVFGGESVGGPASGALVDTIQSVDTKSGKAVVVGHLPRPLAGASSVLLGGNVYVAGGVTTPTGATAGAGQPPTTQPVADIWAFDAATGGMLRAGTLPEAVAYGAVGVVGARAWIVGGERNGSPVNTVEMMQPDARFGTAGAPGAGSPFFGAKLLVADRGNNRLILLNDEDQVVWTYPSASEAAPPGGFYYPDDAFFAKRGTEIVSNQEDNDTIVILAFPSGQLLWQYGHPRVGGSSAGYLNTPDDAYLLKNGQVTVADAYNCRILFINADKTVASQIGTTGTCEHQPPSYVGSPNGDTPLADGNVLVSEINGSWISEYTPTGQLVWTVHPPVKYPSDPQELGPDLYLVSDYAKPGAILEFNREGQVLYRYSASSGPGELDHPSLTELLPSGVFMTNDDYNDRMVAIDPTTNSVVWQYGVDGTPGTAAGLLNTPDGFDLLTPDGSTPTHPTTG